MLKTNRSVLKLSPSPVLKHTKTGHKVSETGAFFYRRIKEWRGVYLVGLVRYSYSQSMDKICI